MRSTREPTRVASHTPSTNPNAAVMHSEVVSSSIVDGSRSITMSTMRLEPSVERSVRAVPRSNVRTRATMLGMRPYQG